MAVLCCMLYTASVECIVKLDCMFVIWSQSKFNLYYLHQTSSHNFLCHKHAISLQKRFHFHFLGHKHVQTILAKSLLSNASVHLPAVFIAFSKTPEYYCEQLFHLNAV